MAETFSERVEITNASSAVTVVLDGNGADINAGGDGTSGTIILRNSDGNLNIRIDARLCIARLGGSGRAGTVLLYPPAKDINDNAQSTIRLEAGVANIVAGGNETDGTLILAASNGQERIRMDARRCTLKMGGFGDNGRVLIFPGGADQGDDNQATLDLNGDTGDIILRNTDCAEDFDIDVSCLSEAEPGTVMALDDEGWLRPSEAAYDKRVAGVVSGAGNCKPGIILDRQTDCARRRPLALMGKVFCKVDATFSPIAIGDLLTTSLTPGHAMKATDPSRAFGATLGKALQPLSAGTGLIPILVALH